MQELLSILEKRPDSLSELRGFFERCLKLEENEPVEPKLNDISYANTVNRIYRGTFAIQKIYGEPNHANYKETPVEGYLLRVFLPERLQQVYRDSYHILYPDGPSKFFKKNHKGVVWNCVSERCKDYNHKIGELSSMEKVSFYHSKMVEHGFYKCREHGCKNLFSISDEGEAKFWVID